VYHEDAIILPMFIKHTPIHHLPADLCPSAGISLPPDLLVRVDRMRAREIDTHRLILLKHHYQLVGLILLFCYAKKQIHSSMILNLE
jgi:hypothetical protein